MTTNNVETIARVCHEVNRAICESFGDMTQPPWGQAAEWQRDATFNAVRFALENPSAPASAQHDAWMADKHADGWRFGETKDPEAKTHPCLVPFEQLPPEQRVKDATYKAIVNAMSR